MPDVMLRVLIASDDATALVEGFEPGAVEGLALDSVHAWGEALTSLCWDGCDVCVTAERLGGRPAEQLVEEARRRGSRVPVLVVVDSPAVLDVEAAATGAITSRVSRADLTPVTLAWMARELHRTQVTQSALRDSEATLRAIFNSSVQAFVLIDKRRKIRAFNRRANEAAKAVFGSELREGASIRDYVTPEVREGFEANFPRALAGDFVALDRALTDKSGVPRWFEFQYVPVFDDDGAVIGVCMGVLDIDERKRAVDDLARRHALFESLAQSASDAVLTCDTDANIRAAMGVEAVLGFSPEELEGENVLDLAHDDDVPSLRSRLETHLVSGSRCFEAEARMRHRLGTYRWVHVRGVAERAGEDDSQLTVTLADITDEKILAAQQGEAALHDTLTGLANRDLFLDRVGRGLARRKRRRDLLYAVLAVDIDSFRRVNDTTGFVNGDRVLVEVARRLEWCVREQDTVARLGADDFAILLEDISRAEDAVAIVERILAETGAPIRLGEELAQVVVKVGVALSTDESRDASGMLREADTALYSAKRLEGPAFAMFDARTSQL